MRFLLLSLCLLPILANCWDYPLAGKFLVLVGGGKKIGHMMRMSKRDAEQGPKENYWVRMSKRDDEQEPMENFMIRINRRNEEWGPKEDYMMKMREEELRPKENYEDQMTMWWKGPTGSMGCVGCKQRMRRNEIQRKQILSRIGK